MVSVYHSLLLMIYMVAIAYLEVAISGCFLGCRRLSKKRYQNVVPLDVLWLVWELYGWLKTLLLRLRSYCLKLFSKIYYGEETLQVGMLDSGLIHRFHFVVWSVDKNVNQPMPNLQHFMHFLKTWFPLSSFINLLSKGTK